MNNLKIFLKFLSPYKKYLFLAFASIIIANCASLIFPWALKLIVDEVALKKQWAALNLISLILIAAFAIKFYFSFLREYLCSLVGEKVVCDLRNKIYWHLQLLSVHYVENTPKGKIISGITQDVESIRDFLFGGAVDFIYSLFSVLFVFSVLFTLDWKMSLVSFLYLPAFAVIFFKLGPRLKERHSQIREKFSELTSEVNEVLQGIRVVAGFSAGETELERFSRRQKEMLKVSIQNHRLAILLWTGSEFLGSLALVTLVWFGASQVIKGSLSIGTLIAFYSYLAMLFYPVIRMAIINDYYQEASAAIERIQEGLGTKPKVREPRHPIILKNLEGNIKFSNLSFCYEDKKYALSDIDFEVKKSEVVALLGKSGAGKTTLINLLLRFYDPQKGEVLVDGCNLKELDLKSYRSRLAMVIQDDYLFGTTVKENIAYSRPQASEEEIIRAAKGANAHDFIIQLPSGYDTQIGERGVRLSYGQRQRISIARAILRNPDILILDEATSNIDSQTEKAIIEQAFRNLMQGRTTLVISHRLSAVSYADKIVFLEDGRITEAGAPDELMRKKGDYWKMLSSQYNTAAAAGEKT